MSLKKGKIYWDVFISHASEDKEVIALPLTNILKKSGLTVWLDKHELFIGDSLRRKIEEGLSNSRFGVVILSENFFKKEWPQKELDALISKEEGHSKVILPVWHNISKSFVSRYSILLADKLAVSTNKGLDFVANEILRTVINELITEGIYFSGIEIDTLLNAIKYYRSREGCFSDADPLVHISVTLKNKKNSIKTSILNESELSILLKVINENIDYLNKYDYVGLSKEITINNKYQLLIPIFDLRNKILKEIAFRNHKINAT
jgi:hypothetical protein